jgi:hypothetical protein
MEVFVQVKDATQKSVDIKRPSELELYYLTLAYQEGRISFKEWRKQVKEWALSITGKAS